MRERGLEVRTVGPDESFTVRPEVSDDGALVAKCEFVVVAVKSYSLSEVGPSLVGAAKNGATIVPAAQRRGRHRTPRGARRARGRRYSAESSTRASCAPSRASSTARVRATASRSASSVGRRASGRRRSSTRSRAADPTRGSAPTSPATSGASSRSSCRWGLRAACRATDGSRARVGSGRRILTDSLHEVVMVARASAGRLDDGDEIKVRDELFAIGPAIKPSSCWISSEADRRSWICSPGRCAVSGESMAYRRRSPTSPPRCSRSRSAVHEGGNSGPASIVLVKWLNRTRTLRSRRPSEIAIASSLSWRCRSFQLSRASRRRSPTTRLTPTTWCKRPSFARIATGTRSCQAPTARRGYPRSAGTRSSTTAARRQVNRRRRPGARESRGGAAARPRRGARPRRNVQPARPRPGDRAGDFRARAALSRRRDVGGRRRLHVRGSRDRVGHPHRHGAVAALSRASPASGISHRLRERRRFQGIECLGAVVFNASSPDTRAPPWLADQNASTS